METGSILLVEPLRLLVSMACLNELCNAVLCATVVGVGGLAPGKCFGELFGPVTVGVLRRTPWDVLVSSVLRVFLVLPGVIPSETLDLVKALLFGEFTFFCDIGSDGSDLLAGLVRVSVCVLTSPSIIGVRR